MKINFEFGFYARLIFVITLLTTLCFATVSFTIHNETCGSHRIDVRTLTDSLAKDVNFTPSRVEVTDLLNMKKPENKNTLARTGFEFKTFQVNCRISEYRIDSNGDIYLTAYHPDDSTKIIIMVLTNPECSQAKISEHQKFFVSIRNNFWLQTLPDCKVKKGMYKIVGVGYYDKFLDQVTLNPVTSFVKFW